MISKTSQLEKYHSRIEEWAAAGQTLRQMATLLQAEGVNVDFNAVNRYCNAKGISLPKKNSGYRGKSFPTVLSQRANETTMEPKKVSSAPLAAPKVDVEHEAIESFHSSIVAWRADGLTFGEIADNLAHKGLELHWHVVERYCDRLGILFRPKLEPPSPAKAKPKSLDWMNPPLSTEAEGEAEVPPESPLESAAPPEQPANPDADPARPSLNPSAETVVPVPPAPWEPPALTFAPLPSGPWWTADLPMLEFGEGRDAWTLQDACEGTFILGATGSGKTSGSGHTLAKSFLGRGFGGLVLVVKPEECRLWQHYAEQAGRADQLCVVEPGGRFRLNFLDYEVRRPGVGSGLVENLVNLFSTVLHSQALGEGDTASQNFWVNTGKQLLRNAFRILLHATERLSLQEVCQLITEAPNTPVQVIPESETSPSWFFDCLRRAQATTRDTPYARVIKESCRYWLQEFPALAEKTRSCVVIQFTSMADGFVEPAIYELFCTDTTLIPEAILEGAIIVVNLPLKQYDAVGRFAQLAWKYLFQKMIERRSDLDDASRRPAFLWVDEAQYLYSSYDGLFQSTARSSRCATVYLTQNLPGFYALAGASNTRDKVDGFLGNLNTKIIHYNNDPFSNQWAAAQIGKYLMHRFSSNSSTSSKGLWNSSSETSHSSGMQETIDYEVQPSDFLQLRTGSERFKGLVDAYFVKGGATFSATGKHYFKTVFQQENRP